MSAKDDLLYLEGSWLDHLEVKIREVVGQQEATWNSPAEMGKHLDPVGYVERDHLRHLSDRIASAVKDVENGKSRFLLVSMPPRLGKSLTVSVHTPAWVLHKHPDWEIMLLSHGPDLAAGWGRQIRRTFEDHPELGLTISADAGAVTDWEVTRRDEGRSAGGGVLSKSIRQSVTGRGAKCVSGETTLESEHGKISAAAAYDLGITSILAHDDLTGRAVWRKVVACQRSRRSDFVEIRTTGGRILRCTPDHLIRSGDGYVPAGDLRAGDPLVAQVPEPDHAVSGLSRRAPRVEGDTVSSVVDVGGREEWVYDFQVEGTHNFFAGEVCSHNCMILDDVVKDFADAHSKRTREFVWDWWQANSRTRLHPPALVIAVGTRWHEDDLLGRFQSTEYDGDPDEWEVISLPALAEEPEDLNPITRKPFGPDAIGRKPGEPLLSPLVRNETPEQALERWSGLKRAVGTYAWEALFQQRPNPAGGSIFISDWWRFWRPGELPPVFDRLLTSWDMAFKGTDTSDYVVGQLWGVHNADRYLLKQTRDRLTFTETLPRVRSFIEMCNLAFPQGVHEHVVEDKANGTAVIDVLRTEIPGMIPVNPTESKEARARASSPEVESGNVYLPADEAWTVDFIGEHTSFPNGGHDDQVDAGVQARMRLRGQGNVVTMVPQGRITRGYQRAGSVGSRRQSR